MDDYHDWPQCPTCNRWVKFGLDDHPTPCTGNWQDYCQRFGCGQLKAYTDGYCDRHTARAEDGGSVRLLGGWVKHREA